MDVEIDLAQRIGRRRRPGEQVSRGPDSRARDGGGLTPRQRECLDFFRGYYAARRIPPTVRDIMRGMDVHATNPVTEWLKVLVARGFLETVRGAGHSARYIPARCDERWDDPVWLREEAAVLRHAAGEMERAAAELEGAC